MAAAFFTSFSPASMPNKKNKPSRAKRYILVAEDDPGIIELFKIVLVQHGHRVIVCSHGHEVLKQVAKASPALIIMDLWLPGIQGAELTQRLKSGRVTRSIPILIVSAQNNLDKVVKNTQADGFLPKPFDIAELISTIQTLLDVKPTTS